MKTKRYFFFAIIFLFSSFYLFSATNMQQLENWQLFVQKSPEQVFELADSNARPDFVITSTGYWNKLLENPADVSYGCYRTVITGLDPSQKYAILQKDSPKTSCAVYVNRKLLVQVGDPFEILENQPASGSHSVIQPISFEFYPDDQGNAEIIYFIANYFYRKSGLNDTVFFGPAELFSNNSYISLYAVICGALIFIGLLCLFQFVINRNRKEYLYLGLTSIALALRISTNGLCLLSIIIPNLQAEIKFKIEYLAMWVVPVCVTQMLHSIYPTKRLKVFKNILIGADFLIGWVSIFLPAYYTNRYVPVLQYSMIAVCVYVLSFSVYNLICKKRYSFFNFFSYLFVIIGALIDVLISKGARGFTVSLLPFFLVAFVIIQILMFVKIQNDIYKQTLESSDKLQRLNEAYFRFVPREFIELLNKDSVINTNAGDYQEITMTIMFCKVSIVCEEEKSGHEHTHDHDHENLDEHFLVFTEYLKQIMPVIQAHNGFVSKILSGGFMALFPKSELDAVKAAFEIKENNSYSEHKVNSWIGLHYGKMIIGTVGEENRLDDTVISDTVNTAARIESVCEKLQKSVIMSHEFAQNLVDLNGQEAKDMGIKFVKLQAISVKGKEKPLQLYEVVKK